MFGVLRFLGKKEGQRIKVYFRNKKLVVKTVTIVIEKGDNVYDEMKRIFGKVEILGYHECKAKRG